MKEIERCVAKGTRVSSSAENPNKLLYKGEPLPSIHDAGRHWDPLFAALQDAEIPLLMHYGSSSNMQLTSKDAPYLISLTTNSFTLPISTTADWIFSGVLGRFPKPDDLHVGVADRLGGPVAREGRVRLQDPEDRGTTG